MGKNDPYSPVRGVIGSYDTWEPIQPGHEVGDDRGFHHETSHW